MRTHAGCRFLFGAAACATLSVQCVSTSAVAQSAEPHPNAVVVHADHAVPANGGVLVVVPTTGHIGPETVATAAAIEVTHDGESVAGTLTDIGWVEDLVALSLSTNVLVGAGLVWTADEPLLPDERYTMYVAAVQGDPFTVEFVATKPWQAKRPDIGFDAELGSLDTGQPPEERCCSTFLDGSGHGGCYIARYPELPATRAGDHQRRTRRAPVAVLVSVSSFRARHPRIAVGIRLSHLRVDRLSGAVLGLARRVLRGA